MKKLYYAIPFLAIILSLWACDVFDGIDNRDVSEGNGINSYFPFEFYVSHPETMYWKSFSDMKLEIDNDHQESYDIKIKELGYKFSAVISGEDLLYLGDGEKKGKIACSIIPDENNTAGIQYFVTPNTDADGKFYYGGKEYGNNEKIKVTKGYYFSI